MSKFNIYEVITQRFIEQLENGVIPWRKPWTGTRNGAYSRYSKRPYSLLNQMLLGKSGEWLTYRQITQLGGFVNEGERSSMVVYWNMLTVPDEEDADRTKSIPILRYYKVFHIDQTTGIKLLDLEEIDVILEPNRDAETVIQNYIAKTGVAFNVKVSDEAFYDPKQDSITIPCMEQYSSVSDYYSTAFHEITHSTGHKDRLDRLVDGAFLRDRNKYAKEELIAEIGSASLCNLCGVETPEVFENSAAYIQNWINALNGNKHLIVSASSKAQKAVDFILNDKQEDLENENN